MRLYGIESFCASSAMVAVLKVGYFFDSPDSCAKNVHHCPFFGTEVVANTNSQRGYPLGC